MPSAAEKRRAIVVETVAAILDRGHPTRFRYEAACRFGVRGAFILGSGMSRRAADETAAEIVEAALKKLGVPRPSRQMGRPEWTQDGAMAVLRHSCANCGKELPESQGGRPRIYCSKTCATAAHMRNHRRDNAEAARAANDAAKAAWRARQPERACAYCREPFRPKGPSSSGKFCSPSCYHRSRRKS